jgi:signal transduction histidine kinase
MRIRWRLALYGSFVAFVSMIVFTVVLSGLARAGAPNEQRLNLAGIAEEVAANVAVTPVDALTSPAPLATVDPASSTDPYFTVLDEDGEVLLSSGAIDGVPPAVPARVLSEALQDGTAEAIQTVAGVELQLVARRWINAGTGERGAVVTAQSTAFIEQRMEELVAVLFVAGVITLLVAAIVGWFVTRRALRPIRRLAETTDRIGSTGDLSQRLPEVKHRDEVGVLTRSFNAMLDRLEDSQARLGRSLESQRRFVADASHELRSPLTTIRNNAGFLVDRPDAGDTDRAEAISDIAAEADRMSVLVDDLLALARSDAGVVVGSEPVDLVELVGAVLHHVPPASVELQAPERAEVPGDRAALHRMVRILVDNAIKHGGGSVDIAIAPVDAGWRLSVADRGPGFPPEDLVRVFDRFYRADPSRASEGSGLGMAIARGIADAHRAAMVAANRPGGGAVIEVELPGGWAVTGEMAPLA